MGKSVTMTLAVDARVTLEGRVTRVSLHVPRLEPLGDSFFATDVPHRIIEAEGLDKALSRAAEDVMRFAVEALVREEVL